MRPTSRSWWMLGGIVLGAAIGCTQANAQNTEKEKAAENAKASKPLKVNATRVEVATIAATDASLDVRIPGEVEGGREATLSSPRGGQVEHVAVAEGDTVKHGQLLVQVDTSVYALQVEQAEAELEQAKKDLERATQLGGILAEAERERSALQVRLLESRLKLARLEVGRSMIRAPFSGVVTQLDVEKGEVVAPAARVLQLVQLDPIKVMLSVPDRDVVAITEGTDVAISAGARGDIRKGKIQRVGSAGDSKTRTFEAEILVENPDHSLLPGMIASVLVERALGKGAVVVPQNWLVTQRDKIGVFVVDGSVARWRDVKVQQVVREQVVIASGLKPGDRVVITGHRALADGDQLIIARAGTCCKNGRVEF